VRQAGVADTQAAAQLAAAMALHRAGRLDEAAAAYAGLLDSGLTADAHQLLGVVRLQQGRPAEARALIEAVLPALPHSAPVRFNLGLCEAALGNPAGAAGHFRAALDIDPAFADCAYNLGNAERERGDGDAAVVAWRRALALQPRHADSHANLGVALQQMGQFDEAETHLRAAVELEPGRAAFHLNLGNLAKACGAVAEALACFERAVALAALPDPASEAAWHNRLFVLNYRDDMPAAAVAAEHIRWGRDLPTAGPLFRRRPHADGSRTLRVGYLSGDFRRHSVASFIRPVLECHDRDAVRVFCYANVARPDAVTAFLRGLGHEWRDVARLDGQAAAAMIADDDLDILIDLSGHSDGNRLGVVAWRPAPVQATWMGYPNITGLPAMDWRITDAIADPAESDGEWLGERPARLPGCFLCYGPPHDAPAVAPLPSLAAGCITFGSFNALPKITETTFRLWAGVLHAVPGSRLLLKAAGLDQRRPRAFVEAGFARHAIEADRLILLPQEADPARHLARYGEVDIALDTHPYNGTTTTCEALWMGVPVVTLAGDRHAARVGASLLTAAGMAEHVAGSYGEFVEIARRLALDPAGLAAQRALQRHSLQQSHLLDAATFTRQWEALLESLTAHTHGPA